MEKTFKTDNNIDIHYYPGRHTHSFCLSLFVKAGVLYEEDSVNGITHFLEHILFRNINHRMNGQMYHTLDKAGLYFNGVTYKEFMELLIIGAPEHFEDAAEILLKAFDPITLPAAEVKTEQQRVKAEIREAEEFKSLDYFAGTHVWNGTSLRNTILGTKGNVSTFSRSKVAAYHQDIFTGENLFFYVTGNVEEARVKAFASKVSAIQVGKGSKAVLHNNNAPVPVDFGNRNLVINIKNSNYTMVQFSFDFVTKNYTAAELALLYDILFSGENSLVHQELSEKRGMIYSYTSALEKYNNIGRLFFTYEVSARDLYESIKIVSHALTKLQDNAAERLALVLPEYVDNAYIIYDDNEGFGWQRAYETHIMDGESRSIDDTKKNYARVTASRIKAMAEEIFQSDNLVLSLKCDKKKVDVAEIKAIIEK